MTQFIHDNGLPDGYRIPFNRPYMSGRELIHITEAYELGHLSGDGRFTGKCNAWIEQRADVARALLTTSCTAALEMAALLLDLQPGDEVIMPSYTFVSTANAVVLRGATPVFVDVRHDTLNLDETLVEAAVTDRTRAIFVVHYAGVGAEMDTLSQIAQRHGLALVEDAAQGVMASYKGRALGSIGDLGAFSFHETKNIIAGEAGALLCRDDTYAQRAEILREKGTNRGQFFRGQVDKYTWVDQGSSYLPGEITAAFLWAQMELADAITQRRLALWDRYFQWAAPYENAGLVTRPGIPDGVQHNAHMFYLLLPSLTARTAFIDRMAAQGISCVFHYVPLHSAPAGLRFARAHGDLAVTDDVASRLVRMPLWVGLEDHLDRVLEAADTSLRELPGA